MDTVEKMSANRNQNLSVLHLHSPEFVDPPITTFTDTGGSLRTARRIHSSRFEKTSFTNEKSVKHHSFENYVSKTLDKSHKEESGSNNKSISVMITTGVNSTSVLNSPGRELSPVRWCDREVDGVYLGKSGWVQVQQRSLDESRKLSGYKINPLLCPHNSVRLSNYQLNNDLNEKKESTRPFCLPLSVEKQKNRELTLESLRFKQECQSVSPPPITPIISPPPAFKDTSLENNFLEPKKTLVGRPPLLPRSKTVVDYENPPLNESSFKNSLPYRSRKLTSPMDSDCYKQNNSSHMSHAKSLDEDASKKIDFNEDNQTRLPISFLGFHSLDRSVCKQSDVFETNETDSSIDGYDDGEEEEEEEEEEEDDSTHYVLKNSPFYETLKSEAVSRDGFRSYHFPRNATETSCSDSSNVRKCSKRSSSLESCNSSCSDKNSSTASLRGLKKEKENWQESEDSFNWDCKTLRVRRSRSLQLSEKHSPNCQSLVLVSTGKSWDQISNEKFSHPRSKKKEQCHTSLQNRHTSTTVGRDGTVPTIPREKSRKHNLQRMIRLENQRQEELFREAKKEARIISEFLNGSRSRAAARNLLMHRYLNQPEDEVRKEDKRTPLKQASPEPEYGVHFLGTNRKYQDERHNSGPSYTNKIYSKEYVSRTLERDSNLKPSFSFLYGTFETSDEDAVRLSSDCISNENIIDKGLESLPVKKKKRKNKLSSQLASDGRNQICSSAIRDENQSFLLNKVQKLKKGSLANGLDTSGSKSLCKEGKQNVLSEVKKGQEKHKKSYSNLCDESPSTSSSSNDIWFNGSCSKTQRMRLKTSSPTEEYPLKSSFDDEDSTRLLDVFSRRNESAPTDDDIIFVNCHQKSLSLPKSFLSERNGRICERQSNFFSSEKQYVESSTPDACVKELPIEFSKTAPATPVRDFKNDKNKINLKEKCKKSSSAPILDESCDSEWPTRRDECSEEFTIKPLEMNKLKKVLEKTKITSSKNSGASSETTLKKFKKRFSLKFSKAKENLMDSNNLWIECPIRNTISESLEEDNPRKNFKNIEPNVLGIQTERNKTVANQKLGVTSSVSFVEDHKTRNKIIKNTNCSSRDSGIHVENLGSMAEGSSESLYAVNLHGTDSLRKVRQNGINATEKSFRPQTEINSQIFINKFKNDFLWKSQNEDYFSGVRRTNSDLGGQRVLYRGKRNYFFPPNISTSSFINKSISKDKLIPKDYGWLSEKTLLKRSFSQPLGVNDFSSPLWRHRSLTKYYNFSEDDGNQNEGTSEDEAISGSEMSYTSLKDRKKCFDSPLNKEEPILAEAVWDHVAMEPDELPFRAGDVIKVLRMCDRDWWWGTAGQNSGYFPSAFVRLRVSQEDVVEDFSGGLEKEVQHHATTGRCKRSTSFLSIDQIRSKVIWELLNTERSFVKVLHDIADGFIVECKRRSDMFTPTQISTIFSNLESLLGFQKNFLIDLETRVNIESPHNSCVGEIFLDHKSGFQIYSEYCNSHPMAIATLQELYQVDSYNKFFEACRLMRGLNEIPLDGYLLTPVQRICKYPLQLAELLKYTKPEHPDHKKVAEALEAMKEVANLINERKRKMESLEKLAAWQQRVEGWEGEDLIEVSSQLIHQGDAIRITSGMWTSNITLFLFDHQIIYCKKDLLKKNTFIYKGRLCLDTSEITDIPDGRDQQLGVTVKNGLKIHSCLKNKWLLFCCRSVEEKSKWLESFAEERRIVGQDVQDGLAVTHGARQLAKLSAKSKRRPPNSSRSKDNLKTDHFEGGNLITNLLNPNTVKMSRRVGTWFMFGGGKKGSRVN